MFAAATVYFISASFGENIEVRNHQAKAAETNQENLEGAQHHGVAENSHVATSGGARALNNESTALAGIQASIKAPEPNHENITNIQQQGQQKEATETANGLTENKNIVAAESGNESTKRSIEFPLFLTAGIAYVLVGFWMIKDKKNSRVPYIIATVGSLLLIGLYTASHTVGFPLTGLERVGVLDLLVAALQIGIVGCCSFIMLSVSEKSITRIPERSK
jgi:hypothetical protein